MEASKDAGRGRDIENGTKENWRTDVKGLLKWIPETVGQKESKVLEMKLPAKVNLPGVLGLDHDDAKGLCWGEGQEVKERQGRHQMIRY